MNDDSEQIDEPTRYVLRLLRLDQPSDNCCAYMSSLMADARAPRLDAREVVERILSEVHGPGILDKPMIRIGLNCVRWDIVQRVVDRDHRAMSDCMERLHSMASSAKAQMRLTCDSIRGDEWEN